jgi:hypothetical protein
MKLKLLLLAGLGVSIVTYCILAYIYMWPPVVRYYWNNHTPNDDADPCVNNLRQIDAGIDEWAIENKKTNGTPVTFEDIKPYTRLNSKGEIPSCPAGGKYTITVVGQPPTCSLGTNEPTRIRIHYFYWEWSNSYHHRLP